MLKQIDRKELPRRNGKAKTPARRFAEETLREFLGYEVGQIAEVTGWPVDESRDARANAARARSEIYDAAFYMEPGEDYRDRVRVFRSGERVFLERTEPKSDWKKSAVGY